MNPIPLTALLSTYDTDQPETQWLIPNMLPIGLTILYGPPRIGKSWFTLHLALSIALGESVLGQLPTTPNDVLYLGLQDTPQQMCARTRKLLATRPTPTNLTWTNQWNTSSSDTDPIPTLDLWLTEHPHTHLLVIDSLQQLTPTPSSLSIQQELLLLHQLKSLANHHRIAILITSQYAPKLNRTIHNEYPHAHALANATLVLKPDPGQTDAILLVTGTDLPDQELSLHLPTDTMSWTLIGPASDHRLSLARQDILALLQEHRDGPLRPKEVAALLHKDVRAITKLLFDMSHASQIRLLGRGQYMTIKSSTPTYIPPSLTLPTQSHILSNNGNISNDSNHSLIEADIVGPSLLHRNCNRLPTFF